MKTATTKQLAALKNEHGLTSAKIAHLFGVQTETVNKWLYENRLPKTRTMYWAIRGGETIQ